MKSYTDFKLNPSKKSLKYVYKYKSVLKYVQKIRKEWKILYEEWKLLQYFSYKKYYAVHDKIWTGVDPFWAMIKWWEKLTINNINWRFCGLSEVGLAENEFD